MKKEFFVIGFLCLFLGVVLNFWYGKVVSANQPVALGSTVTPSMYYDEDWVAVQAYASSDSSGYQLFNPHTNTGTNKVASLTEDTTTGQVYISTYPEMFVTRWEVRGHIHYQ